MALTDLTRISTAGIATGSTIDSPILRKDVDFRGNQVGVNSAFFDASERRLDFKDNVKLRFGDSGDLQLQHNGGDSVISQSAAGTGNLKILSGGAQSIECVQAGAVIIAHNGTTKLSTTTTGASITGGADTVLLVEGTSTASSCLLYTSPSPRDRTRSRMPSSA